MRSISILPFLPLLLTLLILICPISAATPSVQIKLEGNHLTLKAENISLTEVFKRIDLLSGIRIYFKAKDDEIISVDMTRIPLEKGLFKLVRHYSHAWVYDTSAGNTTHRIESLFIYGKTSDIRTQIVWKSKTFGHLSENYSTAPSLTDNTTHPLKSFSHTPFKDIDPLMRFDAPFPNKIPENNPHHSDPRMKAAP